MKKLFTPIEHGFQSLEQQFKLLEFFAENMLISVPIPEEYEMGGRTFIKRI
jgi:hypothetical protein